MEEWLYEIYQIMSIRTILRFIFGILLFFTINIFGYLITNNMYYRGDNSLFLTSIIDIMKSILYTFDFFINIFLDKCILVISM